MKHAPVIRSVRCELQGAPVLDTVSPSYTQFVAESLVLFDLERSYVDICTILNVVDHLVGA